MTRVCSIRRSACWATLIAGSFILTCAGAGFPVQPDAYDAAAAGPLSCAAEESSAQTEAARPTGQVSPPSAAPVPVDTSLTNGAAWKQLALNVRHDQATVVKFPLSLAHGHHWEPALAIAAITAGMVALDPHDTPFFRQHTADFHTFNHIASGINTGLAIGVIPAAFYALSAKRHDSYGKETVFLAAEAAIDTQILDYGMKLITRRITPLDVPPGVNYSHTWFKAGITDPKSFPSGHVITAFALADVFTERYPHHRWVPWVAYGLAGTIAFSRLTRQAHFPSDVFAGAVLGTVVSHYLVLHRHTTQ